MFSAGHCLWIGISAVLIIGGLLFCVHCQPGLERLLKTCLAVSVLSEGVKLFSVIRILPFVAPVIEGENAAMVYVTTGQYAPYLEMAHLPLELCSLQMVFMSVVLWSKSDWLREKLLPLIYVSGTAGGLLGILMAYIAGDFSTVRDFFTSPRVWQYFLYHSMVVTLALYLGFRPDSGMSVRNLKSTLTGLILLDIPTFYLNSIFSQPVYVEGRPVGLVYGVNFFSSYVNPLGLVLKTRWQWGGYLIIRFGVAVGMTALLLALPPLLHRKQQPAKR